jgi:predicted hydrocarbon binding protein
MLNAAGLSQYIGNFPPDDLEQGITFSDYTRLCLSVEDFYGRAARGLLNRIGRTSFRYGLRKHPTLFKAAQAFLKLRSPKDRLKFVLDAMAKGFTEEANEPTRVEGKSDHFILTIDYCAACWERKADKPSCHVDIGFIEEAGLWATGSAVNVEEIFRRALNDPACQYRVDLSAL